MWIILIVLLTGEVKTLVGGRQGFADGVGKKAKFYHPTGLSLDVYSGILYVADHVRILFAPGVFSYSSPAASRRGPWE